MADLEELWTARREAAKSTLKKQHGFHVNAARDAQMSVIYMDACGIEDGVHAAVRIVEESVLSGRAQEAIFHKRMAREFAEAIANIEALTYTAEGNNK